MTLSPRNHLNVVIESLMFWLAVILAVLVIRYRP